MDSWIQQGRTGDDDDTYYSNFPWRSLACLPMVRHILPTPP